MLVKPHTAIHIPSCFVIAIWHPRLKPMGRLQLRKNLLSKQLVSLVINVKQWTFINMYVSWISLCLLLNFLNSNLNQCIIIFLELLWRVIIHLIRKQIYNFFCKMKIFMRGGHPFLFPVEREIIVQPITPGEPIAIELC